MPQIAIRYFAAAAEATGTESETLEAATIAGLRAAMLARHGSTFAAVLDRCSLLVDGVTQGTATAATTHLDEGTRVDVLPPFAGG